MKIRTQLTVAFVVLAVVPLALIVFYSYDASQRAVRRAMEDEAGQLATDMKTTMSAAKDDLRQRLARLGRLPFRNLLATPSAAPEQAQDFARELLEEMGETASLLQAMEFLPTPAPPVTPEPPPVRGLGMEAPEPPVFEIPGEVNIPGELSLSGPGGRRMITIDRDAAERRAVVIDVGPLLEGIGSELPPFTDDSTERSIVIVDEETPDNEISTPQIQERLKLAQRYAESVDQLRRQSPEVARDFNARVRRMELLMGQKIGVPVVEDGRVVGRVVPQVSIEQLLLRVLAQGHRASNEIPFVLDAENNLYFTSEKDEENLLILGLARDDLIAAAAGERVQKHAVVATELDPQSGVRYGIVRPIRESLAEIGRTAFRNLLVGLALIGLALWGIVPLTGRIVRDVEVVTAGAERIASGDLETRVELRSSNEIGQLAAVFNRMAGELRQNQDRLLSEERRRRDQEVRQRLLEAENARKSEELEEARALQLSLLPERLPEHPHYELAVDMRTATEVGGDYYDARLSGRELILVIGDATGHGARAGTLVTATKSLFVADAARARPHELLASWSKTLRGLGLGRMAMALTLARFDGHRLTLAAAGMPPVFVWRRASAEVEEMALPGIPLGTPLEGGVYAEHEVELSAGDVVLMLSDGLPELPDAEGEPFGYTAVRDTFQRAAPGTPSQVITSLLAAAEAHRGGPPDDDMTFVVVRVRG